MYISLSLWVRSEMVDDTVTEREIILLTVTWTSMATIITVTHITVCIHGHGSLALHHTDIFVSVIML